MTDQSFGAAVTPHMFVQKFEGGAARTPEIIPYQNLSLSPLAKSLHYGQSVFEGMKAFRQRDGGIALFRPRDHLARLNRSAARVCLPSIDVEQVLEGVEALIAMDAAQIPEPPGSLYVRPVLFATEGALCPISSGSHMLVVVLCPVDGYIDAPTGLRLTTAPDHARAAPGGTGAAKCAGNYAAALPAVLAAKSQGFDEVLWLDATERRYIEEVGTMNLFVVRHGKLLTPPLSDTILSGITRDTVMTLSRDCGLEVQETQISVDAVDWRGVDEIVATGTAAGIMGVRELVHRGHTLFQREETGPVTHDLMLSLADARFGEGEDPHCWRHPVPVKARFSCHPSRV